jgi:hypothetical protein
MLQYLKQKDITGNINQTTKDACKIPDFIKEELELMK